MRKLLSILLFSLVGLSLWGQEMGTDSFTLTPQPWNGDWMQERLDQMVHGELFKGYPGPLPKLWYALGLDPEHPSVDFELKERVKRDSPYWFGSCNGWSAAATLLAEPEPMVIHGVKFFSSEIKAILAGIWKDNIELPRGENDSTGITARSFEEVLYTFVAQNRPIIFDVVLGLESWNYPVVGFERTATENGDWVEVSIQIRYANTVQMNLLDSNYDSLRYLEKTYTYRFNDEGTYEWTGSSLTDRPQRAWYTNVPHLSSWFSRANRHVNMSTYQTLQSLDTAGATSLDQYEPNNQLELAAFMRSNLLMGSLPPADDDYFQLDKNAGEPLTLNFNVYDGPEVDLVVLDAEGQIMQAYPGICELSLDLPAEYAGAYHLQLTAVSTVTPSYYKLQHPKSRGWYQVSDGSRHLNGNLKAINLREDSSSVIASAGDTEVLPPQGSLDVERLDANTHYRGSQPTVWVAEQMDDRSYSKTYHRGHPLQMPYVVPHLTCRNGWKTTLYLGATNDDPIWITTYGIEGSMLERTQLPQQNVIDLGDVLSELASSQGSWFRLETSRSNLLEGLVSYSHDGINYNADFDLQSRPRNGELVLHNLPQPGQGWLGLSLVNTSGVRNPIRYRLLDEHGDIVEEGSFILEVDEKWLGLPSQLVSSSFADKYSLWFFAQFNLETLALRHDTVQQLDYAHRIQNPSLDFPTETYLSVPVFGPETSGYMIANMNNKVNYLRFRGYGQDGTLLVEHRLGGKAMRNFEWRYLTFEELLAEAELDAENHGIDYFKVTSSWPILAYELVGLPGATRKTTVHLVNVFPEP